MNTIPFYLIFGAIIIEIVKTIRRKLRKSKIVAVVQLFILALSIIVAVEFSASMVFLLASILIVAVVVLDLVDTKLNLIQKFIIIFCLILVGVALIVYGTVKA